MIFRASMVGDLMSYPDKNKLPDGAITLLDKMISQHFIKWQDADLDYYTLQKGIQCENESIELYNEVHDTFYVKNAERIYKDTSSGIIIDQDTGLIFDKSQPTLGGILTGECDLLDKKESLVIDIKTAYSKKTYPFNLKISKLYEWQLRAYMYLYGVDNAELAYCLVDTPFGLVAQRDPEHWHIMSDVDKKHKVTTLRIERDAEKELQLLNRLDICNKYINQQLELKS